MLLHDQWLTPCYFQRCFRKGWRKEDKRDL